MFVHHILQQKEINSIDISHDGKYLVASSEDNSVSLYDLERGEYDDCGF